VSTTDAAARGSGRAGRPGEQDWIGLPEAAALFGLSRYTLARAARDAHLATRRTGKIWLTTPAAVDAWLRGARHRPGRTPRRRPPTAPVRSASSAPAPTNSGHPGHAGASPSGSSPSESSGMSSFGSFSSGTPAAASR
jgi:hypothetical protein